MLFRYAWELLKYPTFDGRSYFGTPGCGDCGIMSVCGEILAVKRLLANRGWTCGFHID